MGDIEKNISYVRERIKFAAAKAGRDPKTIKLVAATKAVTIERIQEAIAAGVMNFGENYIQEALPKIEKIGSVGIQWHFIGHLQTNKAKYAVRLFDLIHSVDSINVARELDKRGAEAGKVVQCMIEINLSQEKTKFGISKLKAPALAREMSELKNISLRGLMTIPPYADDPESARPYFIALRELKEWIEYEGTPLSDLSMGMTIDFETAIEEGATMVRVGTAIFGERRI